LTRPARASPALPGLGATRRLAQNASSRTEPSAFWCARRRASPRCCQRIEASHTPESSTIPARPRQRPLGHHRTRSAPAHVPKTARSRRPKMLSADSYISRCQRRAPGLRVAIGALDSSPMEPPASRPRSRFGRTGRTRRALFTPGTCPTSQPLTPVSPASAPDIPASPAGQPMPLLPPPRERLRFPRHRTSSANLRPSSGRSISPGVAAWIDFTTSSRLRPLTSS